MATLESIADIEQLPIDEAVARSWTLLRVHLAKNKRRLNVNDLSIAATALAHGVPVVTQDDFGPVDTIAGLPKSLTPLVLGPQRDLDTA